LEGSERALYEEDGCKSELNIPIFIGREWVGSIGVSDYLTDRQWNPADVQVLETAAAMIGGFWERKSSYHQLEQHIRSKDAFLASISHEIRTPLTAVLGYASIMHADAARLDPDLAEQVTHVAEQATEVADIVEDLLVAARADIDDLAVAEESVEIRSQLRNVVDSRPQASSHRIKIFGEDVWAWTDAARLRQIIRCLLSNAIRYGGEHIEIRVAQVDQVARISFIDDGPGVDDEDRDQIFEPFHRAHHRKGLTQSVGLGLYVARHLARIMNGELTYTRSGGRTVFELTLPTSQQWNLETTSKHDNQTEEYNQQPVALFGLTQE
jgi:signal transduction histidine kinase